MNSPISEAIRKFLGIGTNKTVRLDAGEVFTKAFAKHRFIAFGPMPFSDYPNRSLSENLLEKLGRFLESGTFGSYFIALNEGKIAVDSSDGILGEAQEYFIEYPLDDGSEASITECLGFLQDMLDRYRQEKTVSILIGKRKGVLILSCNRKEWLEAELATA